MSRRDRISRYLSNYERTEEYGVSLPFKPKIYIIGSMRNPKVPKVAKALRGAGWDSFDEWYASGPESDDKWQEYERDRGRTYREALAGAHAQNVFEFDKKHLDSSQAALLVAPSGKSAHLELGYMIGRGYPGYILLDGEPERYDVMMSFSTRIFMSIEEMLNELDVEKMWENDAWRPRR